MGLTDLPNFIQTGRDQTGLNQVEDIPRWIFRLFQTLQSQTNTAGKKKETSHASIHSVETGNFIISNRPRASLHYWLFAKSAGAQSATDRRVSRSKYRDRRLCPLQPNNGHSKHGHWFLGAQYRHNRRQKHRDWFSGISR